MSASLIQEVYEPLQSMRLIDPHTHINPHSPASETLPTFWAITTTPNWRIPPAGEGED